MVIYAIFDEDKLTWLQCKVQALGFAEENSTFEALVTVPDFALCKEN
jgi:hypothetical protein